jgi:hypothetical protein
MVRDHDRSSFTVVASFLASLVVMGFFDAVLLRAEPVLLAAIVLGSTNQEKVLVIHLRRVFVFPTAVVTAALLVAPGALKVAAHVVHSDNSIGNNLEMILDSGNFILPAQFAAQQFQEGDCGRARVFAEKALSLNPHVAIAQRIVRECPMVRL